MIVADGKKITGSSNVGILVGLSTGVGGTKQTLIQEVYVSGNVESKGTLVGGIVGRNNNYYQLLRKRKCICYSRRCRWNYR